MMPRVLNALTQADEWNSLLGSLPPAAQDVYFSPAYIALHSPGAGAQPLCFVYADGGRKWMYPFVLRSFRKIGSQEFDFEFHDIESAYGYGGPVTGCTDPVFLGEAHRSFADWCRSNRVIAEFVRLHPVLANEKFMDPATQLILDRETRSIALSDLDAGNPPFDNPTRYMLRRAEKLGIHVDKVSVESALGEFVSLYTRTMNRLGADRYYYFDDAYFRALGELCSKTGFLLTATHEGRLAAGAVFLGGRNCLHYHLSASDPDNRLPGVMNLLLWKAAVLGHSMGLPRLHLGGGRSRKPDDSLLRFKMTMSTDGHQFYIGKRVHDSDAYQAARSSWASQFPDLEAQYGQEILCYHRQE